MVVAGREVVLVGGKVVLAVGGVSLVMNRMILACRREGLTGRGKRAVGASCGSCRMAAVWWVTFALRWEGRGVV